MKTCKGCIHFSVCCLRHFEGRRCERFKQGWISVEDELPNEDEHKLGVLVFFTTDLSGLIGKAWRLDGRWLLEYPYVHACPKVTHWMPLPDPPEVKKRDLVEVVRCKECKHWGGVTFGNVCRKYSGIDTNVYTEHDHYCSYGERRER